MICSTKLQKLDSWKGHTQEFHDCWKQQQRWIGIDRFDLKLTESLKQTLRDLALVVASNSKPPPVLPVDANITIPFFYANLFGPIHHRQVLRQTEGLV
jgi:hypothetical protein